MSVSALSSVIPVRSASPALHLDNLVMRGDLEEEGLETILAVPVPKLRRQCRQSGANSEHCYQVIRTPHLTEGVSTPRVEFLVPRYDAYLHSDVLSWCKMASAGKRGELVPTWSWPMAAALTRRVSIGTTFGILSCRNWNTRRRLESSSITMGNMRCTHQRERCELGFFLVVGTRTPKMQVAVLSNCGHAEITRADRNHTPSSRGVETSSGKHHRTVPGTTEAVQATVQRGELNFLGLTLEPDHGDSHDGVFERSGTKGRVGGGRWGGSVGFSNGTWCVARGCSQLLELSSPSADSER